MTQPGCDGPYKMADHIEALQEYRTKFEMLAIALPEQALAATMLSDLDKAIALLKVFAERMHALQLLHGQNRQNH